MVVNGIVPVVNNTLFIFQILFNTIFLQTDKMFKPYIYHDSNKKITILH